MFGALGFRVEGCSFGFRGLQFGIRVHVFPEAPSNSVSTGLRVMRSRPCPPHLHCSKDQGTSKWASESLNPKPKTLNPNMSQATIGLFTCTTPPPQGISRFLHPLFKATACEH